MWKKLNWVEFAELCFSSVRGFHGKPIVLQKILLCVWQHVKKNKTMWKQILRIIDEKKEVSFASVS